MRRSLAAAVGASALLASLLSPAPAAVAADRSGVVTVTIPSRIVIDGSSITALVSSGALHAASDTVAVRFTEGGVPGPSASMRPNTRQDVSTVGLTPSASVTLRARSVLAPCDLLDGDPCVLDDVAGYAEVVRGLTLRASNTAVAKYGARVTLRGARAGGLVTWTATATRWNGTAWTAWAGATLVLSGDAQIADDSGTATWTERTDGSTTERVVAVATDQVWGASSRTVAVAGPTGQPKAPLRVVTPTSAAQ